MQGYSQGPATNQTDWLTDWHRGFGSHTVTLAQEITGDHRHQPFHLEPWRWSAVLLIVFPVLFMSDKTNLTGWYRVSIVIQSHQCWRLRSLFPRDLNASCWCNMLWDHLLSSPLQPGSTPSCPLPPSLPLIIIITDYTRLVSLGKSSASISSNQWTHFKRRLCVQRIWHGSIIIACLLLGSIVNTLFS